VERISQTLFELSRDQLADPARAPELEELLSARDPVRLVTSRGLFRKRPLALVAFEALEPAAMIFSGSTYVDALGTSRVLARFSAGPGSDSLPELLAARGLGPDAVVHATPGSGLLMCGADRGAELAAAVASGFRATTGGLHARVAVEEMWPDEALLGRSPDLVRPPRFGALLEDLERTLRPALASSPSSAGTAPEAAEAAAIPGFLELCGACRKAPASVRGTGGALLCEGCDHRRALALALDGSPAGAAADPAEIADPAHPDPSRRERDMPSVALIAAGPLRARALIASLGGLDQVWLTRRAMQRSLDSTIRDLVERLALHGRHQRHVIDHDLRLLVVPASRAPDVVRRLVEGVEAEYQREAEALAGYPEIQEGLRRMRVHAGFCVAASSHPPALVCDMALALQASARRAALRRAAPDGGRRPPAGPSGPLPDGAPPSTVDFWVLHEGVPAGVMVDELRRDAYEQRRDLRLTRRPYVYEDFKRDVVDALRPARRIRPEVATEMRRRLIADGRVVELRAHELVASLIASSVAWRAFAGEVAGRDPSRWDEVLLRPGEDGTRETALIDVIELAEFQDRLE
jgi:hypothetical protein